MNANGGSLPAVTNPPNQSHDCNWDAQKDEECKEPLKPKRPYIHIEDDQRILLYKMVLSIAS